MNDKFISDLESSGDSFYKDMLLNEWERSRCDRKALFDYMRGAFLFCECNHVEMAFLMDIAGELRKIELEERR